MKILVVHNRYIVPGGEDRCVANEVSALRNRHVEASEFIVENQASFSAAARALMAPFGRGEVANFVRTLRAFRPDIVHAHNLYPILSPRVFEIAHQAGARTVLTLHNYRPLCLNGLFLTPENEICERCAGGDYRPGIQR